MIHHDEQSVDTMKKNAKTGSPRRTYQTPALQRFGRLSRLTQGSGGGGKDANGTHTKHSDRNLKENIVRIGTLPMGIGLYLFDYLPEYRGTRTCDRQLGVMADEVEIVMPEAVSFHPDGYQVVNYSLLDIKPQNVVSAFLNS